MPLRANTGSLDCAKRFRFANRMAPLGMTEDGRPSMVRAAASGSGSFDSEDHSHAHDLAALRMTASMVHATAGKHGVPRLRRAISLRESLSSARDDKTARCDLARESLGSAWDDKSRREIIPPEQLLAVPRVASLVAHGLVPTAAICGVPAQLRGPLFLLHGSARRYVRNHRTCSL